jgi:hypothetical protein
MCRYCIIYKDEKPFMKIWINSDCQMSQGKFITKMVEDSEGVLSARYFNY